MNKLSICLIVGNEALHIEDCLKSLVSIADEFSVVYAFGAQKPDDTWSIVRKTASLLGIPLVESQYLNYPDERAAWPHVDSFARARQRSFDQATNDWLMWIDADDLWPDTEANRETIKCLKEGKYDDFTEMLIYYEVPSAGTSLPRERFAKRSANPKWVNPVHESMTTDNPKRLYNPDATVLHAPKEGKPDSLERNLRIIQHALANPEEGCDAKIMAFYEHRELMAAGRAQEALDSARNAIMVGLGEIEQYEALLNLASMLMDKGEISEARAVAHGAINVTPWRREAYCVLAQIELQAKQYLKMLGYTMAMRGIDEPKLALRPWSQRDKCYGWYGAFLHHQALRLNGRFEQAAAEEEIVFQAEGAAITIIYPTMCRGDLALKTYNDWMSKAVYPGAVQWIFAIDKEDDYVKKVLRGLKTIVVPRGYENAVEHAKKFATGKRVEVIRDEQETVAGWDMDFDKVPKIQLSHAFGSKTRYVICGKEGKSPFPDYQPQHCHYELGWEVNTTHVYAKWMLSDGRLTSEHVIVTLPGREFLYQSCFNRVITWQAFCEETGLDFGKPYIDVSSETVYDLVERFERNWHRYDEIYFSGPNKTWGGGAWDKIRDFKKKTWAATPFLLVSLRKRPHESRRDTSDNFGRDVLRKLRDVMGLPIFLVGLNLPDFGVEDIFPCSLQDFASLAQLESCRGILGPHSGPNGMAGLLAPKDKNIIIFPQEYCPSINNNYPTGMGKCLNLNGNIRHWLPLGATPDDIAAKAKEVL